MALFKSLKAAPFVFGLLLLPGLSFAAKDAYEPNNSCAEAKQAELNQAYRISLYPQKDYDYFKLKVSDPGYLQVTAEGLPKELKSGFSVSFFDAQGQKLALASGDNAARVTPGEYCFAVFNWYEHSSSEPFKIRVNLLKEADDFEPNDSLAAAKAVDFGKPCKIMLYPQKDYDYFKLKVSDPGYLQVTAEGLPKELKSGFSVSFFDAQGQKLALASGDNAARVTPGEYCFAVFDWYEHSSPEPFNIRVSLLKEADDFEPNDSMEQAREIPLGRPFSLSLYPQEDRDVFRLKPASSGLFSLNLAAAYEGVGITVDFYDAEKKPIASNVNDIAVEAGSTYYIVIKQSAWHKFGQRPFLLIADIGRHEDTYEPNNSFETAGEIAVPAKLKIAVYPQGDVDYFRLALKEQGYLTELISGYDISTVGKAFYENVLIDVYGEDKEMVGSFNNKASPSGKFQRYLELKPGVYYLRIAAESPAKDFFSVDIGFLPKDKLNEPLPADKKRKDFSFCILGIGMKNDLSAWIDTKLLADNLGGDFILVESKGEIEKAMIKSLQQAKAEIGGNNWYLILLTLLLAGGVFWLFVYLIRRDKKK